MTSPEGGEREHAEVSSRKEKCYEKTRLMWKSIVEKDDKSAPPTHTQCQQGGGNTHEES